MRPIAAALVIAGASARAETARAGGAPAREGGAAREGAAARDRGPARDGALAREGANARAGRPARDREAATVNGLYPLWEQTGEVHRAWGGQVGFAHAQVGLGPVQVGTQPFLDLYGTGNAQAKSALYRGDRLRLALAAGAYRVPAAAGSRTVGNLHAVRLHNPYGPLWLVPASLAATLRAGPRLRAHAAVTALSQWAAAEPRDRNLSAGAAGVLELRASRRWAAMLHGGGEGVPVAPQAHAGLSFAYRRRHLELRAGYARRRAGGESAGLVLLDAALVF